MYNCCYMANIKSSIKRISVTKTKQAQNKPIKSNLANEIKKFETAIQNGELKHAEAQLNVVFSALDSAAADNVIHKNKADRQKSKLAAMLSKQKKPTKTKTTTATATAEAKPAAAKPAAKPATKTATAKKSA